MAAIFMIVATTLITVGLKLASNASRSVSEAALYVGEAENVARAGIVDALGWFGRQKSNGGVVFGNMNDTDTVTSLGGSSASINPIYSNVDQAFNPQYNAGNSQLSDTLNANIGIVNEYPLDDAVTAKARYWARYEIKKQGNGAYDSNAVHDITGEKSTSYVNGEGYVWKIISTGYVYKRLDQSVTTGGLWTVAYNTLPNVVVAKATFSTEFRKLSLVLPAPTPSANVTAALYCQHISAQVTLNGSNTMLNGAVSAVGTYAAMGLQSP